MNILVINSGSSSVKYQILDLADGTVLTGGSLERIGEAESRLSHYWQDASGARREITRRGPVPDHAHAFEQIAAVMRESGASGQFALDAIGHRVVHGGERFRGPTRIDAEVVEALRALSPLAPLHNPPNLTGIEVCLRLYPQVPQVAVFDTAFHQTLPVHAFRYAVPDAWYRGHHVRRYGFHGTSHAYVARQAAAHLQQPLDSLRLITLHLGNGASAAAIQSGHCVDTSMGLTPLEGLMMGTRSGDIDPAILIYLNRETGIDLEDLDYQLNQESGLKGVCGVNDMREAQRLAASGDERARLAIDMYCYRIRKYIGAYYAVLGHLDALVFTAGIGENSPPIRKQSCAGLERFGIRIDDTRNAQAGAGVCDIQAEDASVRVLVVPTNEELEIARQTHSCLMLRA
ncbi:MAG: acetate kinase [Gammaproteobacteria bacterium]